MKIKHTFMVTVEYDDKVNLKGQPYPPVRGWNSETGRVTRKRYIPDVSAMKTMHLLRDGDDEFTYWFAEVTVKEVEP